MSCTDMKALELVFETLFEETAPFPVNPLKFHSAKPIKALHESKCSSDDATDKDASSEFFQSHFAVTNVNGTVVSLRIDRIGLKDAQTYIDPFMTVLVIDEGGTVLDKHDVPAAKERTAAYKIRHLERAALCYTVLNKTSRKS